MGKSTVDKLRSCGRGTAAVCGIRGNDRSMALIELQKLRGIGEKAAEKLWDRGIKSRADVQREAASLELPDATRACGTRGPRRCRASLWRRSPRSSRRRHTRRTEGG